MLDGGAAAIAHAVRVIEQDEVDIARIVEFAGPKLAHTEDNNAAVVLDLASVRRFDLASAGRALQQVANGNAESGIGEITEGGRHLVERPQSGDVDKADQQCGAALGGTQRAHQRRRIGRRHAVGVTAGGLMALSVECVDQFGESGAGPVLKNRAKEVRLPQAAQRKEGRVAEDRLEQSESAWLLDQLAGEGSEIGTMMVGLAPTLEAASRLRRVGWRGNVR